MARPLTKSGASAQSTNRRDEILVAAARRFAHGGFEATTMRDIASDAGLLAGSIYHHFPSKDAIIAAVYALGVEQIMAAVEKALADATDPWARLEKACAAHLEALVAESPFAALLTADLSRLPKALQRKLVALRDRYELRFTELVDRVPLKPRVDRRLLRLQLLGALNWTPVWYDARGTKPGDIARIYLRTIRAGVEKKDS